MGRVSWFCNPAAITAQSEKLIVLYRRSRTISLLRELGTVALGSLESLLRLGLFGGRHAFHRLGIFAADRPLGQWRVFDAVAAAGNGDNLGAVQKAVEDSAGSGNIAQELAPFFERPVAGHDRGAVFITAHDDFEEVLAGVLGQRFKSHVIDDEQVRLEVGAQCLVLLVEGFIFTELADRIEDRAVKNMHARLDGAVSNRLGQMCFAYTWGADQQEVGVLAYEVAGSQ